MAHDTGTARCARYYYRNHDCTARRIAATLLLLLPRSRAAPPIRTVLGFGKDARSVGLRVSNSSAGRADINNEGRGRSQETASSPLVAVGPGSWNGNCSRLALPPRPGRTLGTARWKPEVEAEARVACIASSCRQNTFLGLPLVWDV